MPEANDTAVAAPLGGSDSGQHATPAPPVREPAAIAVLERAVNAMGSVAGWSRVHGAEVKGNLTIEGSADSQPFVWRDEWSRSGRMRYSRSHTDSSGTHTVKHDGSATFNVKPVDKVRTVAELDTPRILASHLPAAALAHILRDPAYSIVLSKSAGSTDKRVRVDVALPGGSASSANAQEHWFLSSETGLPVGVAYQISDAVRNSNIFWADVSFTNFQVKDGLSTPGKIVAYLPNHIQKTFTITSFDLNMSFTDRDFVKDISQ